MSNMRGMTGAQSRFLRGLRRMPGCREVAWPTAHELARWLKGEAFGREYRGIVRGLEEQIKVHLLAAAVEAAGKLLGEGRPEAEAGDAKEAPKGRGAKRGEGMELIRLALSRCPVRGGRKRAGRKVEEEEETPEEVARQMGHPDVPLEKTIALLNELAERAREEEG